MNDELWNHFMWYRQIYKDFIEEYNELGKKLLDRLEGDVEKANQYMSKYYFGCYSDHQREMREMIESEVFKYFLLAHENIIFKLNGVTHIFIITDRGF